MDRNQLHKAAYYFLWVFIVVFTLSLAMGLIAIWTINPTEQEKWTYTAWLFGIVGAIGAFGSLGVYDCTK